MGNRKKPFLTLKESLVMNTPKDAKFTYYGEYFKIGRFGFMFRFDTALDEWVKSDNHGAREALKGNRFVNSDLLMGFERV